MKRLHRWVFNGVARAFAFLLVATLILWAQSFRRPWGSYYHKSTADDQTLVHRVLHVQIKNGGIEIHFKIDSYWRIYLAKEEEQERSQFRHPSQFALGQVSEYQTYLDSLRNGLEIYPDTDLFDDLRHEGRLGFYGSWESGFTGFTPFKHWQSILIDFPIWCLALVLGTPPIIWVVQARRVHRKRIEGECLSCGYDLRATPGRCPECGTMPVQKVIASR